jgi:iron complex outermembrane receptor protein
LPDTVKIPTVYIQEQQSVNEQVIDSAALNDPSKKDLGEILATKANLFVKSYGLGSMATISLRGSHSTHTKLFWNGMSLNPSSNGTVDFALYPSLFFDAATVQYGNASLQSGSGGIGGAVLLENKVSFRKKKRISLQQEWGSFAYRNTAIKLNFGSERWQSISRFMYRTADNNFEYKDLGEEGFPQKEVKNAGLKQRSLMQSVHYRLSEKKILEAHLWYYDSDRKLPPLMTLSNFKEEQKDESLRSLLAYKHYGENSLFKLSTSWIVDELAYYNERLLTSINSTTKSWKILSSYERQIKQSRIYTQLNIDLDEARHPSLLKTVKRERYSHFLSAEIPFAKKWQLKPALRQEWIDENYFFLPSLLFSYQWTQETQLFTQVSKNIKYPSLNDLYWGLGGDQNLVEEQNQSFEFGGHSKKMLGDNAYRFKMRLTAFYSLIDNYIQWQPTYYGYWQAKNLRKVEVKGLESTLELQQLKGKYKKHLSANYTYTHSINTKAMHPEDASVNQQLIYIPKHQSNIAVSCERRDWVFSYQWQVLSERYTTSDNSDWQPAYHLSNVSLAKEFQKEEHKLRLQFSVLNLFDLEYQAIEWRPMPNRNFQLSISYQLL